MQNQTQNYLKYTKDGTLFPNFKSAKRKNAISDSTETYLFDIGLGHYVHKLHTVNYFEKDPMNNFKVLNQGLCSFWTSMTLLRQNK